MKLPYILIIDDDIQVLRAIQRDIRNEYRNEYKVAATESAIEALEVIKELKLKNEMVALFISDQRMPEMEGIAFLEKANEIFPEAKKVLLTAYSDIDAAIKAINNVKLDYYLQKPWYPPKEKLFPVVNDLLYEWQAIYKPDQEAIRIIGFQWSPKSHRLKEFLSGNLVPYIWMDIENNAEAEKYLISANVSKSDLPLVILKDGYVMSDPTLPELAARVGLHQKATKEMYDVLIIGAGPAGLAASVYGSCEGLKTVLIERSNPGGQASSSARIENYLGFPTGLSGAELSRRAITQTLRFGTEILTPQEVKKITIKDGYKITELMDGSQIHSKAIVIATGVTYKKLEIPGLEAFTGSGVYYGAASVEAYACRNEIIYIVGGGNSACQAAMYMCKFASEVNIIIRRGALSQTAANYLVENISHTSNIHVITNTDVIACSGTSILQNITLKNVTTGEEKTVPTKALFIYIGHKPSTDWLDDLVLKNEKGYIFCGSDLLKDKSFNSLWKLNREPFMSETSVPGIFASGDVRFGAITGISSAVGEGSMAIRFVRKYLQEM
ncbi:FAD-dependent oxidoreductase [Chitinophagaceae bacterium LB-8]|uniref:FAD-dependent oxidoreductase n=1 Tax=Paraflavisolibacter caeni TaxID=2982496 RepID=A0A9X2Y1A6_9BACT|nr:FAD-dependent oxidoreductase [Paraflavisolibacter caeni]MCU7552702.1 FAD-dependent oxidoreductase [Paraflavisolibacter caeni]